jgi:hypothetical protein
MDLGKCLTGGTPQARMEMLSIQTELAFRDVFYAPKVQTLVSTPESKAEAIKTLCLALNMFQESLAVKDGNGMDSAFLFHTALELLKKYPCESLHDFVFAFKRASQKGFKAYNKFSQSDVFQIINEYMESKYMYLEQLHKAEKNTQATESEKIPLEVIQDAYKKLANREKLEQFDPSKTDSRMVLAKETAQRQLLEYQEQMNYINSL